MTGDSDDRPIGFDAVAARLDAAEPFDPATVPDAPAPDTAASGTRASDAPDSDTPGPDDPPSDDEGRSSQEAANGDAARGTDGASDAGAAESGGNAAARRADTALQRRIAALAKDDDLMWRACGQPLNDTGNAKRLMLWFGGDIRYVRAVGWHVWTGTHWERKGGDEYVSRLAQLVGPLIEEEARFLHLTKKQGAIVDEATELGELEEPTPEEKAVISKAAGLTKMLADMKDKRRRFGVSSGNGSRIKAMIDLAAVHVTAAPDEMDADPLAFNVANGTLKFERVEDVENANSDEPRWTMQWRLRPHDRADLITKKSPAVYDPEATCPRWDAFMARFLPLAPVRRFYQTYNGLGLTGLTVQQLIFNYGGGANGKSAATEVLARVNGPYTQSLPREAITGEGQRRGDQASPEFARLPGARLVRVSELEKGQPLKESMVKELTGGEPILTRHLHKDFFEFRPIFKPVTGGNHLPEIKNFDEGIWRRLSIIHWTVTIPEAEQRDFDEVVGELVTEASGILNWLIEGLRIYMTEGLQRPPEVRRFTDEHRSEMDPVKRFIDSCVVRMDWEAEGDGEKPPKDYLVTAADLHLAFNVWCRANDLPVWNGKNFGTQMKDRCESFGFLRFQERVRLYGPIQLDMGELADEFDRAKRERDRDKDG